MIPTLVCDEMARVPAGWMPALKLREKRFITVRDGVVLRWRWMAFDWRTACHM